MCINDCVPRCSTCSSIETFSINHLPPWRSWVVPGSSSLLPSNLFSSLNLAATAAQFLSATVTASFRVLVFCVFFIQLLQLSLTSCCVPILPPLFLLTNFLLRKFWYYLHVRLRSFQHLHNHHKLFHLLMILVNWRVATTSSNTAQWLGTNVSALQLWNQFCKTWRKVLH